MRIPPRSKQPLPHTPLAACSLLTSCTSTVHTHNCTPFGRGKRKSAGGSVPDPTMPCFANDAAQVREGDHTAADVCASGPTPTGRGLCAPCADAPGLRRDAFLPVQMGVPLGCTMCAADAHHLPRSCASRCVRSESALGAACCCCAAGTAAPACGRLSCVSRPCSSATCTGRAHACQMVGGLH